MVRQNRLHPRERVIVLEIEKGLQYIHVEEGDYIHSTQLINSSLLHLQLLQWQQGCCHCSSSLFLSILFTQSRSLSHLCSLKSCLFYRHPWCCSTCSFVNKGGCQLLLFFNKGGCQLQLFFNNGGCQWSMVGAVHFLHMQWQQPNNICPLLLVNVNEFQCHDRHE